MGVITSARLVIIWKGVGDTKTIKLAARNMKSWSPSQFLEPAVRNDFRGTIKFKACDFVWHPHISTYPFPCTFRQDRLGLETTSAFHQDLLIIRSFTLHELGQIIDIRSDWSTALVQTVWKWNDVNIYPLFLLSDIGIIGGAWLIPQKSSLKAPELYFCCI